MRMLKPSLLALCLLLVTATPGFAYQRGLSSVSESHSSSDDDNTKSSPELTRVSTNNEPTNKPTSGPTNKPTREPTPQPSQYNTRVSTPGKTVDTEDTIDFFMPEDTLEPTASPTGQPGTEVTPRSTPTGCPNQMTEEYWYKASIQVSSILCTTSEDIEQIGKVIQHHFPIPFYVVDSSGEMGRAENRGICVDKSASTPCVFEKRSGTGTWKIGGTCGKKHPDPDCSGRGVPPPRYLSRLRRGNDHKHINHHALQNDDSIESATRKQEKQLDEQHKAAKKARTDKYEAERMHLDTVKKSRIQRQQKKAREKLIALDSYNQGDFERQWRGVWIDFQKLRASLASEYEQDVIRLNQEYEKEKEVLKMMNHQQDMEEAEEELNPMLLPKRELLSEPKSSDSKPAKILPSDAIKFLPKSKQGYKNMEQTQLAVIKDLLTYVHGDAETTAVQVFEQFIMSPEMRFSNHKLELESTLKEELRASFGTKCFDAEPDIVVDLGPADSHEDAMQEVMQCKGS